jgi:hypothetical protein
LRVEKELRTEFIDACRQQGLAAAAVLRDFMRDYVARESGGRQVSLLAKTAVRQRAADKARA